MSKKHKATRQAPGTRAGVPNREREVVASYPASCPTCHCTEAVVEGRRDERRLKGTLPGTGQRFNRVTWQPVQCLNPACGQHYKRREYHFHPPASGG